MTREMKRKRINFIIELLTALSKLTKNTPTSIGDESMSHESSITIMSIIYVLIIIISNILMIWILVIGIKGIRGKITKFKFVDDIAYSTIVEA